MRHPIIFLILTALTVSQTPLLAQWETMGAGVISSPREIFSISAISEDVIWAIPIHPEFSSNNEFIRTVDGGSHWERGVMPGINGNYYPGNIYALDADRAWIIMINLPNQDHIRIFNTTDGGQSWDEQIGAFNKAGHAFAALHFFDEQNGIGFGSPGTGDPAVDSIQIFRTANGGQLWRRIPASFLPTPVKNEGVWVYSGNGSYDVKGDTLWFVTRGSRVFRTTDMGVTWSAAGVSTEDRMPFLGLSSIAFENERNGIVTSFYQNKAARTRDGGATWTPISMPSSPNFGGIEYVPGTKNTYIVHDGYQSDASVIVTKDGGDSWQSMTYLPSMICMQFLSPTVGFGGGRVHPKKEAGMYRWTGDLSDLTLGQTIKSQVKDGYIKISPNPGEDLIIFETNSVFKSTHVRVEVFALGGEKLSAGKYINDSRINIRLTNLPAGLYLLKISNRNRIETMKFIKQ